MFVVAEALYREHLNAVQKGYERVLASKETPWDAVVLHSGSLTPRTEFDDQFWPLRPTPHFQHWLPLAEADSLLVVRPGKRPQLLWLREPNFWEHAPELDPHPWRNAFDIVELKSRDAMKPHLPTGKVAFVGDARRAAEWGYADTCNPKT